MIEVVGIGGCGGNIADLIYLNTQGKVLPLIIDMDPVALSGRKSPRTYLLSDGNNMGTGGNPEISSAIARNKINELLSLIDGSSKLVIIVIGMGGGTGTGVSSILTRELRNLNKNVVIVGIMPFEWEGAARINKAKMLSYELLTCGTGLAQLSNTRMSLLIKGPENPIVKINNRISGVISSIILSTTTPSPKRIDISDLLTIIKSGSKQISLGNLIINGNNETIDLSADVITFCDYPLFSASHIGVFFSVPESFDITTLGGFVSRISALFGPSLQEVFWSLTPCHTNNNTIDVTILAGGINGKALFNTQIEINYNNKGDNQITHTTTHLNLREIKRRFSSEYLRSDELTSLKSHAPSSISHNNQQPSPNPFFEENKDVD